MAEYVPNGKDKDGNVSRARCGKLGISNHGNLETHEVSQGSLIQEAAGRRSAAADVHVHAAQEGNENKLG